MSYTVAKLNARHHEIIRLAHQGMKHAEIAAMVGVTKGAVSCILRTPLARAEMARLKEMSEASATNVPMKVQLANELNEVGFEALRLNRQIMNDVKVDVRERRRVATHFLDRIVFNKQDDDAEAASFRDLLRSAKAIEASIMSGLAKPIGGPAVIDTQAEVA